MKTRVTFRVADDLAEALRLLPNQTHFVETALRNALGMACPTCEGSGRVQGRALRVPNFRRAQLPSLDRETAIHLQSLVRLARKLAATDIELVHTEATDGFRFWVLRGSNVLLRGNVNQAATELTAH